MNRLQIGQQSVPTPRLLPKPLLDDYGDATQYVLTTHEIVRMAERGIGVFEVYAAIKDPDLTRPGDGGRLVYCRGDIQVVVDPDDKVIVTAIDQLEHERTTRRKPLTPPLPTPHDFRCPCGEEHPVRIRPNGHRVA